jgi:hypothetical protein
VERLVQLDLQALKQRHAMGCALLHQLTGLTVGDQQRNALLGDLSVEEEQNVLQQELVKAYVLQLQLESSSTARHA